MPTYCIVYILLITIYTYNIINIPNTIAFTVRKKIN